MAKRKTKMGRPPKNPKDKCSRIVTLRLTPSQHRQLRGDVKRAKTSVSQFLIECWQKARRTK